MNVNLDDLETKQTEKTEPDLSLDNDDNVIQLINPYNYEKEEEKEINNDEEAKHSI